MSTHYRCTACGATVTVPSDLRNETVACPQCGAQLSRQARTPRENTVGLGMAISLFGLITLVFIGGTTLGIVATRTSVPAPIMGVVGGQEVVIHGPRNAMPNRPPNKDEPRRPNDNFPKGFPKDFPVRPAPIPAPPPKFVDVGKAEPLPVPPRMVEAGNNPKPQEPPRTMPSPKATAWKLPDVPKITLQPTTLTKPTTITLPEEPYRSALGGGGRYWVLATRTKGVFIYDLTDGKQVATIPLEATRILETITAGHNKIALVWHSIGKPVFYLSTYNLTTGTEDKTVPLKNAAHAIGLGCGSDGPILVCHVNDIAFHDLATLEPLTKQAGTLGFVADRFEPSTRIMASHDGRSFAVASNSHPQTIRLDNNGTKHERLPFGENRTHALGVAHDGSRIFVNDKTMLSFTEHRPIANLPLNRSLQRGLAPMYFPAVDGPYYLRLDKVRASGRETENMDLTLFKYSDFVPLWKRDNFFADVPNNVAHGGDGYMLHGFLHFSAATQVAVFATLGNPNVTIVPLKLDAETPKK